MKKILFSDPVLQKLVEIYPAPDFHDRSGSLYESLIREIIGQQLSVKAAHAIFTRFLNHFGSEHFPTPEHILQTDDEKIRSLGLSYAKVSYVKSIANAFVSDLIDEEKIKKQSDEEVIQELIQIKGIGRWTAEMTLIFTLKRPDVFSIGDLGLRRAIEKLYGITDQKEMLRLSETWKPYRSTACWYLWRSLENMPMK